MDQASQTSLTSFARLLVGSWLVGDDPFDLDVIRVRQEMVRPLCSCAPDQLGRNPEGTQDSLKGPVPLLVTVRCRVFHDRASGRGFGHHLAVPGLRVVIEIHRDLHGSLAEAD
jgi:hypothetical protein